MDDNERRLHALGPRRSWEELDRDYAKAIDHLSQAGRAGEIDALLAARAELDDAAHAHRAQATVDAQDALLSARGTLEGLVSTALGREALPMNDALPDALPGKSLRAASPRWNQLARLAPEFYDVTVRWTREAVGVSVLVDGRERGPINDTFAITAGTHQFALSLPPTRYQPGPLFVAVTHDIEVVFT